MVCVVVGVCVCCVFVCAGVCLCVCCNLSAPFINRNQMQMMGRPNGRINADNITFWVVKPWLPGIGRREKEETVLANYILLFVFKVSKHGAKK